MYAKKITFSPKYLWDCKKNINFAPKIMNKR